MNGWAVLISAARGRGKAKAVVVPYSHQDAGGGSTCRVAKQGAGP